MTNGFLLDTNVPSEQIRQRPDLCVEQWLEAQPFSSLFLSSMSIGEIQRGIFLMPISKQRTKLQMWLDNTLMPNFEGRVLSIDFLIVRQWAALTTSRQRIGRPIGIIDGLIAATALEHNLTLVTRNVKDFADLGLTIANPWEQ